MNEIKAAGKVYYEAKVQASATASREATARISEQIGPDEGSIYKLGADVLSTSSYDPSDTVTYKEVVALMNDPTEIRAVPGPKNTLL